MNPQKNESPTMASGTGAELVCNPWTEVPTPPDRFQFVMPASRYYANGDYAFDHIYAGVDGFSLISIPSQDQNGRAPIVLTSITQRIGSYIIFPLEGEHMLLRSPYVRKILILLR